MKKIQLILPLLSSMLLLSACEDNLFQEPQASKVLSNFLRNETESEEYVNAVYANLQASGLYGLYLPAAGEIQSDNTFDEVPANDDGIYGQLDQFTVIPSNGIVTAVWTQSYRAIQKANVVLNRIGSITYATDATRQSRIGEMKFIRALLYFNLVRLYGDVPLVTQETTDPNAYFGQGRAASSQVYDQIKKDLTEAISVLPATTSQPGRVVKTAAQTLLAKVYLTQKNYADAQTLLQAVVSSGQHTLLSSPSDVFSISNENNKEIIFAVQFASGVNGNTEGSTLFQQFSPSGTVSGAKGHNLPTKSLYALYTSADKRKSAYLTATSSGTPWSKKFTQPTTVITDGGSDVVVLRYADVLLMLAEVQNELGNTSGAATNLNLIRTRAGLDNTTATTQADLRTAIDLERRFELVGEGHRWFDLLRSGNAVSVMNNWFAANNSQITITTNSLLLPIPQSQVNTDPSIKQNPGY
ncbi:putative outer membrane starch-binding protein [Spirosoma oryzae]|uniref:Putative outer membrane starch-binding protein n=1 Tax=Spirosoma oryzae TaxID=1469603 RepID=A0A2T0RL88_9BACT|nr:RagB/SusD family nutrient uptake outer membrane protein [Spirosoma oryzae]PRY21928.1 putative outer membrane starch-binding protein [Spirosoma oryzae]